MLRLRDLTPDDVAMARELATDPYVPQGGSLPLNASHDQALAWIERQRGRLAEGLGHSLAIDLDGVAVGHCGLWFDGPHRFTVGYAVVPGARGHGVATRALALLLDLARTYEGTERVEARIEPWNTASIRTAERAGFVLEGTASHRIGGEDREVRVYVSSRR